MQSNRDIVGLGLESSCDETAVSLVLNGNKILSNVIFSQIDLHRDYSGVVPEIASRAHLEVINDLIEKAISEAGLTFQDIQYVAATNRPGLVGSLLIALQSAKAISFALNIPLVALNHLEAHLYAPHLEGHPLRFPFLGLLISGGNTALYRVRDIGNMDLLGKTLDDAVGEAYDKVAKFLDLGYPGGPIIDKMAKQAKSTKLTLPKILSTADSGYRFSYSGLKTAVITHYRENPGVNIPDLLYSFQERALEILIRRVFSASQETGIRRIVVAGGVASNTRLREMLRQEISTDHELLIPSPILCTDNAAMIAGLGYHYYSRGLFTDLTVDVKARV